MKNIRLFLILLFAMSILFFTSSCTSFQISGLEFAPQLTSGVFVGNFDIEVRVTKFWGSAAGKTLANMQVDETDQVIMDAIKEEVRRMGGNRAVNVQIAYSATFLDVLLNSLTLNIYAPAYVRVTGTVIR
jgi:hypothetical protein